MRARTTDGLAFSIPLTLRSPYFALVQVLIDLRVTLLPRRLKEKRQGGSDVRHGAAVVSRPLVLSLPPPSRLSLHLTRIQREYKLHSQVPAQHRLIHARAPISPPPPIDTFPPHARLAPRSQAPAQAQQPCPDSRRPRPSSPPTPSRRPSTCVARWPHSPPILDPADTARPFVHPSVRANRSTRSPRSASA